MSLVLLSNQTSTLPTLAQSLTPAACCIVLRLAKTLKLVNLWVKPSSSHWAVPLVPTDSPTILPQILQAPCGTCLVEAPTQLLKDLLMMQWLTVSISISKTTILWVMPLLLTSWDPTSPKIHQKLTIYLQHHNVLTLMLLSVTCWKMRPSTLPLSSSTTTIVQLQAPTSTGIPGTPLLKTLPQIRTSNCLLACQPLQVLLVQAMLPSTKSNPHSRTLFSTKKIPILVVSFCGMLHGLLQIKLMVTPLATICNHFWMTLILDLACQMLLLQTL